jgi:hypothetical protein
LRLEEEFEALYTEFKELAGHVWPSNPSATLNRTALLNEAYLKLARDAVLDFVLFLDGSEENRPASLADAETFRATWRRPKWDIARKKGAPFARSLRAKTVSVG